MSFKYKQGSGKDSWKDTGSGKGNCKYDSDNGSVTRWDNFSGSSSNSEKHHHEWINQKSDGSYEYGHGEHDNH